MKPPFIRSPYNYDVTEASDATAIAPGGPSLTVQSMTDDADLNVLMKRFGVTGQLPENPRLPSYGDFFHISDYRSALEAVHTSYSDFMEFPADVRAQFENNPQLFLDFVENPGNIEQVKKWFPKESVSGNGGGTPNQAAAPANNPPGATASGGGSSAGGSSGGSQ